MRWSAGSRTVRRWRRRRAARRRGAAEVQLGLERFTEQSQFVIVTHNKRTMRRCEVMYGITQEEFGISKLIGMKLAPASA